MKATAIVDFYSICYCYGINAFVTCNCMCDNNVISSYSISCNDDPIIIVHDDVAVYMQIIRKGANKSRSKVLKEIEIFHLCRGHDNILQLIEYFEEEDRFYLIFEKMEGGGYCSCFCIQ